MIWTLRNFGVYDRFIAEDVSVFTYNMIVGPDRSSTGLIPKYRLECVCLAAYRLHNKVFFHALKASLSQHSHCVVNILDGLIIGLNSYVQIQWVRIDKCQV